MNLLQENYSIAKNHIDSKTHDGFFDELLEKFPNAISLLSLKTSFNSSKLDIISPLFLLFLTKLFSTSLY